MPTVPIASNISVSGSGTCPLQLGVVQGGGACPHAEEAAIIKLTANIIFFIAKSSSKLLNTDALKPRMAVLPFQTHYEQALIGLAHRK